MPRKDQRPEAPRQLFESIFEGKSPEATLRVLSEGLIAFLANARRLMEDVILLVKEGRFATAKVLLTTTNEEMAKSYILLDACRLDFAEQDSTLRCLCHAFYDHVAKYAYNEIANCKSAIIRDMERVKIFWESETTKWWPSDDPESGEPDMPHQTYFVREMPLYVEFGEYDQKWYKPENEASRVFNSLEEMRFDEAEKGLKRLQHTFDEGLYPPECLAILNGNFKRHYMTDRTLSEEIHRLYMKTAQQVAQQLGINEDAFLKSALHEWPLYYFTTLG